MNIEEYVTIRPGVKIGENTTIKVGAILGTGVQIGNDSYIGPGAILLHMNPDKKSIPAVIGNNVFVGAGAIVCPGVVVVDNVVIGAGSVVAKSITEEGTYVGNPARKIR